MTDKFEEWKSSWLSMEVSKLKRVAVFYGLSLFVLITAIAYFWCGFIVKEKTKIDPFIIAPFVTIQFLTQIIILHYQYKSQSVPMYVRAATEFLILVSSSLLLFFVLAISYQ